MNKILLIGIVGVGAYFLLNNQPAEALAGGSGTTDVGSPGSDSLTTNNYTFEAPKLPTQNSEPAPTKKETRTSNANNSYDANTGIGFKDGKGYSSAYAPESKLGFGQTATNNVYTNPTAFGYKAPTTKKEQKQPTSSMFNANSFFSNPFGG
jgi:hypothetical protein